MSTPAIPAAISFTRHDDPAQTDPFMVCDDCGEDLCTVEEGDTLTILVDVARGHIAECGVANVDRP